MHVRSEGNRARKGGRQEGRKGGREEGRNENEPRLAGGREGWRKRGGDSG